MPQTRRSASVSFSSVGKRIGIGIALVVVVLCNFWLARTVQIDGENGSSSSSYSFGYFRTRTTTTPLQQPQHSRFHATAAEPVFVVGLPKSGTTSIHQMFQCSGIASQHYCCCGSNRTHTHCNDNGGQLMAECMRKNVKANRSILQDCGSYHVYAQMDAEFGNSMFLPQRFQMGLLHEYAPNATLILNLRPAKDWVKSVTNWYGLGGRFLNRFHIDYRKVDRHKALEEIYNNHSDFIRNFVRRHPSHGLVEVNITDPNAGMVLSTSFAGLDVSCWGIHNKNKKRDKLQRGGVKASAKVRPK